MLQWVLKNLTLLGAKGPSWARHFSVLFKKPVLRKWYPLRKKGVLRLRLLLRLSLLLWLSLLLQLSLLLRLSLLPRLRRHLLNVFLPLWPAAWFSQ